MDKVTDFDLVKLRRSLEDERKRFAPVAHVNEEKVAYNAMLLSIVDELQALRFAAIPGTAPDYQEWCFVRESDWENNSNIRSLADKLRAEGGNWFRVTKEGSRYYVDAWRTRPAREAGFVVFPYDITGPDGEAF
ncbi:MAG TPA: hypothetical protein VIL88_17780 [Devosia sp.]|jgi:hypothetical protein|uniref:hypothetical protein n=1 Tax=Devosia sp. TaxID=1871048 RepID=UPI002F920D50